MAKDKNVGEHHDHITVLEKLKEKTKDGRTIYLCKCDCGKYFKTSVSSVHKIKSCGCMTKEYIARGQRTHGESKTRLYEVWHRMKERCYREKHKSYPEYGGRGITICEEWKNSYVAFRDWALANGYDENAEYMVCTLDRIDVNGNYEPSNCRWVSMKVQCNNKRNNHTLTYNGETHTIAEWAEITGIQHCTLSRRLKKGWSVEKTLSTPLRLTEFEVYCAVVEMLRKVIECTADEISKTTGTNKVSKYISMMEDNGYKISKGWKYIGKPSGWRNRVRTYRLEEKKSE